MSNQKKSLPAFAVLTIICLVAALALAGTNAITKGPIQEHAMAAQREAFGAVMTADEYIEMTIPEGSGVSALVEAKANGATVGYCVVASTGGYAGPVAVTLGVDKDGKVTGAKIGDTTFAETSGFGSRWLDAKQAEQFVGIDVKEGGAIEALTGATVTSTAVLNASNTALKAAADVLGVAAADPMLVFGVAEKKPVEQMTLVGDIHEGSAKGFASDVKVQLTKDASGAITALAIESSGETPSFGTRCMEDPEFAKQFVGKTAPFAIGGNIDALAGATVTSTAVVNAVNAAVEAPANPDAVPFGSETGEEAVETAATLTGDVKTASAKGFQSDVEVQLTVDANGAIAELIVNSGSETPGFGTRCAEDEAFLAQFIGKTAPVEVDALAGATVTSKAIIEAVNAALPAAADVPAGTAYEAAAKGFQSDVKVTVYADDAGVITGIVVDSSKETQGFGTRCAEDEAFLAQFIGKTAPVEVDALAGATVTSKAIIEAVNAALPAAAEEAKGETKTGKAQGFQSEVTVTLTVDAGVITGIVVDSSKETQGFGTRCAEDEAFLAQFIGKKATPDLGEGIEALTGATVTSNAVVEAANAAIGVSVAEVEIPAEEAPAVEEAPAAEELTASAQGLLSDVKVTITLNADGTIATMVVDASGETAAIAAPCTEEAFLSNFIGKAGPFEGVEVVTGATFTSNAVINAVNSLFPAAEAPAAEELTASAQGLLSDVKVTITLNADGTIATMVVDASGETAAIAAPCTEEAFLSNFIGKAGPFEGVEVVTGATFTSNAVINAVNSLFPAAEAPAAEELTASAQGLLSDVKVTITLNADGTIATMVVDASGETAAIAAPCTEEAFLSNFIGKAGPFEGVEVVTGATFTSNAVINAVNSLFPAAEAPAAEELTASAQGLLSDVKVTITLNADGTIATMVVDASGETAVIAAPCTEEAFLSNFIGKAGPFEGVEVVTGATFTSNAVINAVNSLFAAE